MNEKKLLVEYSPLDMNEVEVALGGDPEVVRVKALLQQANGTNQNGRVYPKEVLMREVNKYIREFVQQRRALGELDHPESTVISVKNVSHNIVEMHWEGDQLVGTLEILPTPMGNVVKNLLKNRIQLGVSSRGVGSVKEISEGVVEVEDDFQLLGWDIVSNPSVPGAFLHEGVMDALKVAKQDRINELVRTFFEDIAQ